LNADAPLNIFDIFVTADVVHDEIELLNKFAPANIDDILDTRDVFQLFKLLIVLNAYGIDEFHTTLVFVIVLPLAVSTSMLVELFDNKSNLVLVTNGNG
jgi:hypothetical protein